ncbi:MAG: hypothetical protein ACOVMR_05900 [Flavobacteriales bacterium]|jgi:hypothetical protein
MEKVTVKPGDSFKISENWESQAKKLKAKYSSLTDADLKFVAGKENDLLNRIGVRLNKKREEVIEILNKGTSDAK